MLAKRIIPCLDLKEGKVVKGINFLNLIDAGDPVETAKRYNEMGADEIVFLDITASSDARSIMLDVISKAAEEVYIPLTVGGGLRTVDDIKKILRAGADKVSVNSAAIKNPNLISEGAELFGSQCICLAIDAKKNKDGKYKVYLNGGRVNKDGKYKVYLNGGRVETELDAVEWAYKGQSLGAGEILLTSMDADGTKDGYDLELTKAVSSAVNIPVIASGGAGKLEDFKTVLTVGGADAALAASLFHFKELTIEEVKKYLAKEGVPIRL